MRKTKGFTLPEIMIAVVILSVLVAVAYPSYKTYVRKSHRADGTTALLGMQLAQEKYRFNNSTYGSLANVWGGVTASQGGYYTLAISGNTGTAYVLTATGVGDQANDTEGSTACSPLTLTVSSGTVTRAPAACW